MRERLTTSEIAPRDRFAFWREAVCESYVQLDCNSPRPDTFHGEIQLHRMSQISASVVGGSEQLVRRRRRDIGRASEAFFLVSLQLENDGMIEQADRVAILQKGDFTLYSSVDPYTITVPDNFKQLVIQVPRDRMLSRLPNADLLTATAVRGNSGLGGLVRDSIPRLIEASVHTDGVAHACLQDTIVDVLASGIATLRSASMHLTAPERQQMARARSFICNNLKNPDFNRVVLADHLEISVRRLSEIFKADGTPVAMMIREMRLQRIAADLCDIRCSGLSISQIAMKWGINNLQHFPRMFRKQFGKSPRDYQNSGKTTLLN